MKKNFLMCVLLGLTLHLSAQDNQKHCWISANLNYFGDYANTRLVLQVEDQGVSAVAANPSSLNLGLALKIANSQGWFHEVSLNALNLSKNADLVITQNANGQQTAPVGGEFSKRFFVYTRYEYGKLFKLTEDSRLQPGISLSMDPFFRYGEITPVNSVGFPLRYQQFGAEIRMIPRLEYHFSKKCSLQLKVPVGLCSLSWQKNRVDNPLLLERQRINESYTSEIFGLPYQGSVGVSLRI